MESRKVPRLWWKEDEAEVEVEKVAVGAGGCGGRRTRPAILARWRQIGPARRHMVFGWWTPRWVKARGSPRNKGS